MDSKELGLKGDNGSTGHITTFTGRGIFPLSPNPADIFIEDIAHSLANQCRFTGHTREFYSTAQHSVMVSWIVPMECELEGLLHDGSETYLSDIARPIKLQPGFGDAYHEAESRLEKAIAERFELPYPMTKAVKDADAILLWTEMRDLMPQNPPKDALVLDNTIEPWSPKRAEREFLRRYWELTGEECVLPDEQLFTDGRLKALHT
jgi:hypothetical protein